MPCAFSGGDPRVSWQLAGGFPPVFLGNAVSLLAAFFIEGRQLSAGVLAGVPRSGANLTPITLLGQKTYLADSMQFALGYIRIEDGLDGVYYISTLLSGDSNAMYLNQFYHVECELASDFGKGIPVAEQYLVSVISALLRDQRDTIEASVGTIEHLTAFLSSTNDTIRKFPALRSKKPSASLR